MAERIDRENDPYKHYVSKSRLSSFNFCRKRYYQEYILGERSEQNYSMAVGSRFHEWADVAVNQFLNFEPEQWMSFITPSYTPYERNMMEWFIRMEQCRYQRTHHIDPLYFVPYSTEGLYLNHEHELRGFIDRIDVLCPTMISYMVKDVGISLSDRTINNVIKNVGGPKKQLLIIEYKTGKKSIQDKYFRESMREELSFYKFMIENLEEFKDYEFPCGCLINPQSKEVVYVDFLRKGVIEKRIDEMRDCTDFSPVKPCSERKYIRCNGCKTHEEAGLYHVKQEDIDRELAGVTPDSWESNLYI